MMLARKELLKLVLLQNSALLLSSATWLWFFPNSRLWTQLRLEPVLIVAPFFALLLIAAGAMAMRLFKPLREAQLWLDQQLFSILKPQDALLIGLLTGIAEELCFRGLLQNSWGLLTASFVFGLMHMPGLQHWAYAVWACCMGLVLGLIYQYSDNLLLVMAVHVCNNCLALWLWPRLRAAYIQTPRSE